MNCKSLYDQNIVLHPQSFIAYFFYVSSNWELNVVFRSGKQYRYNITHKMMNEILEASNRGNIISQKLLQTKWPSTFVKVVPQAEIEQVTLPKAFKNWLAK